MPRVDKRFSVNEDARLEGRTGLLLEIYAADGKKKLPPDDMAAASFSYIEDQKLWRIPAGLLPAANYSYAVFEVDSDGIRRIVRQGNLQIHAGAVKKTADETELEMIEAVLAGDDHDVASVKFPDGREILYSNREAMRMQANRLRERIAVQKRGSLMGIRGAV